MKQTKALTEEQRKRYRATARAYWARNRAKIAAQRKAKRENEGEAFREKQRTYRDSRKDEVNQVERARRAKGKHEHNAKVRRYRAKPEVKAKNRERDQQRRKRNREKINARSLVRYSIQKGLLPPAKEMKCGDCGNEAQEYHHPDYAKPRQVAALCCSCHQIRHQSGRITGGLKVIEPAGEYIYN